MSITIPFRLHEANVAAEAYSILKQFGYNVLLQYECITDEGVQCYLDLVLIIDGKIVLIVEFKNRKFYPYESGIIFESTDKQLNKYLKLGPPLYLCNGFNCLPDLVDYITDNISPSL
jgi:hypothetical protein